MILKFDYTAATRTCYRFEHKDGNDVTTLYLKKKQVETAGIDPKKGVTVTIKQKED